MERLAGTIILLHCWNDDDDYDENDDNNRTNNYLWFNHPDKKSRLSPKISFLCFMRKGIYVCHANHFTVSMLSCSPCMHRQAVNSIG